MLEKKIVGLGRRDSVQIQKNTNRTLDEVQYLTFFFEKRELSRFEKLALI